MDNKLKSQENNSPTMHEIQFVSEQIKEGTLKGEYKDEEKTITWEATIQVTSAPS